MSDAIDVRGLRKTYAGDPPVQALRDVSLAIRDSEFFTLLGPSGCGKTTLLRIIAGFEDITAGQLSLFGRDIASLPPDKRPVNTVFQHYALFPHMTVAENVAFGLKRLNRSRADVDRVVRRMLDLVKLAELADRHPEQLSGGQQQRVALARALAPQPRVLLLDEPLSALDLKLRQAMRLELKALQQETGITFVFVTHDQEEALTMSDRIAVMSEGQVQQVGTPAEIYEKPANRFVADFVGDSNFLEATVLEVGGAAVHCRLDDGPTVLAASAPTLAVGDRVTIFLRPEKIRFSVEPAEGAHPAIVRDVIYLGDATDYCVELDAAVALTVRAKNEWDGQPLVARGDTAFVRFDPETVRILVPPS